MSRDPVGLDNKGTVPGFFGKLPACGDFVSRQLPRTFREPWDAWLRSAIDDSRRRLGDRWLDCYLTSPMWRFGLCRGACGAAPAAGILMPSVDRVGRYFPLTIAVMLPADPGPADLAANAGWFRQAEAVALSGLADELDVEAFASAVQALGPPKPVALGAPAAATAGAPAWHCALGVDEDLDAALPALLRQLVADGFRPGSLWWSGGSERVAPCLLICRGLPDAERFTALLAGGWPDRGWTERPLTAAASEEAS